MVHHSLQDVKHEALLFALNMIVSAKREAFIKTLCFKKNTVD